VKSPKNLIIGLLSVALVAAGALAWHQYRDLVVLRAQLADGDSAALKRQLADAQKTIRSLEDRIAALRGTRAASLAADDEGGNPAADRVQRAGGRFGAFANLSSNPEFQKLMAIQLKGRLNQTYGPLFKALNLSPEQLAQFQSLLADKQQALMDVFQAAREQGINPRTDPDGFKTLMNQAISQSDQTIQQAIGDSAFQQYQQYQQTLPERNVANSLQQSLSYTQTPLTDDQASQLVSLLAQNQPQRAGNGTVGTASGGDAGPGIFNLMNGGGTAKVTNDSINQAQGILSAPQIAALQQIQIQQQAQQQMQQMMRSANPANGGGGRPAPVVPVAAGGK
jgi:hypothetical protein